MSGTTIAIVVVALVAAIPLYVWLRNLYRCSECNKWTLRVDPKRSRGVWRVCRNNECGRLFTAESRGHNLRCYGIDCSPDR